MHHYGTASFGWGWLALWAVALALPIIFAAVYFIFYAPPLAGANGVHGACDSGVVSIVGTDNLVTYDAGDSVVTGVCIKAGNTMQHVLFEQDVDTGCYVVNGVGTSVVTVTRTGEGRTCQGLSHIDVLTERPEPSPTPTVTPTPTTTSTPTPTATPVTTPEPTPTPTTIETPTPILTPTATSTFSLPAALPDTGGEPAGLPRAGGGGLLNNGGTNWFLVAVGASLIASEGVLLAYLARRGR